MTYDEFWVKEFGNVNGARDFAGRTIYRNNHNDGSAYAWNVDHIMPESLGGTDTMRNLQIAHVTTNQEKSNKTTFSTNGKRFQVKSGNSSRGAGSYDYSSKDYYITETY